MRNSGAFAALVTAFASVALGAPAGGAATGPLRLASDDLGPARPLATTFVYSANGCSGANRSPALRWSGAPPGVREFALTLTDPDAGSPPFVHWTLYHLGARSRGLARASVPPGAVAGPTDWGSRGYGGPCPPPGATHRYVLRLDALDTVLPVGATTDEPAYERARRGHVLASATLSFRYARPSSTKRSAGS